MLVRREDLGLNRTYAFAGIGMDGFSRPSYMAPRGGRQKIRPVVPVSPGFYIPASGYTLTVRPPFGNPQAY